MPQAVPAPPAKSRTGLFIGLGCFALFLVLGIVVAVGAWVYLAQAEAPEIAPAAPLPADPAAQSAAPASGDVCARAAACCKKITSRGQPGSTEGCDRIAAIGAVEACKSALSTYQQSAKLLGITCD